MFCSLSCRVIIFYRQKAETYSCDKCFPRKETSFKKGSVGFYAQTEIEFFSLLVFTHPIRFSVCMATRFWWWTAPKQARSLSAGQRSSTRVLCSYKWLYCCAYVQTVSDISSTTWDIHITSLCRLFQMQQNWIQKIVVFWPCFPHGFEFLPRTFVRRAQTSLQIAMPESPGHNYNPTQSWVIVFFVLFPWSCYQLHFTWPLDSVTVDYAILHVINCTINQKK